MTVKLFINADYVIKKYRDFGPGKFFINNLDYLKEKAIIKF